MDARLVMRREAYILKRVKDLVALGRSTWIEPEYRKGVSDAEIVGMIISKFLKWSPEEVIQACQKALEDSNLHELCKDFEGLVKQTRWASSG